MKPELVRDLERPHGWWLMVGSSEQSMVDLDDPGHLEFEYVQLMARVIDVLAPRPDPVRALHLGGGLLTIPRWLAWSRPGSSGTVAEHSSPVARMAAELGEVDGVEVRLDDATQVLAAYPDSAADLVVCDVYDGPETVTSLFTLASLGQMRAKLVERGVLLCNLSDASPFDLARVVVATLRCTFSCVGLLAEPPVLRGRRSGNLVLIGTDRVLPIDALVRTATAGPVRARLLAGDDLDAFTAMARPAAEEADLPESGESIGRFLK